MNTLTRLLGMVGILALSGLTPPEVASADEPFAHTEISMGGLLPETGLQSRAGREIEKIVTSPLRRLPANARARGWAEVGLHARAGDEPGRLMASPVGAAYYRLADPVYVTVALGAIGKLTFEGDDAFEVDAYVGNPYLGFGLDIPVEGVDVGLTGGFTVPIATEGGVLAFSYAQGMRGAWEQWLWATRRLSLVGGMRFDAEGVGPLRFGGEFGIAPMFWFGEGTAATRLVMQGSMQASTVLAGVIDVGLRGLGVGAGGDSPTQASTEVFANVQGPGQRIYHARFTIPLNEPYGFAFSPGGHWALHLGAGMVF